MSTPMNTGHTPAASPATSPSTTLHGRWLLAARVGWLAVALLTVGIFVAGISLQFVELQQVCTVAASVCEEHSQLTPNNVRELQSLGLSVGFWAVYNSVVSIIFVAVWWVVGATIFARKSEDWMALLVSLFLVTFALAFLPDVPRALALDFPVLRPPVAFLRVLGDVLAMLFFYLFPSGRFVPRWTRWLAIGWVVHRIFNLFTDSLSNVYPWSVIGFALFFLLFLGFLVSFIFAQVYRYRRVSDPLQRQQTKWVVFGLAAALVGTVGALLPFIFVEPASSGTTTVSALTLVQTTLGLAFMLLIPLSIGVAVLRSRLFDIDVLINRTLVYGALTVSLALVYVSGVVMLQTAFRTLTGQESQLAVVASTLAIAALFNPLRRRVQNFVDRRFYRRKYDAARTLEAYSARLRDRTDLDELGGDLVTVVRETVQPAHISVQLLEAARVRGAEERAE